MKLQHATSRPVPSRFDPFLGDAGLRRGYQLLLSAAWDDLTQFLESRDVSWLLQAILTGEDAAVETVVFERMCEARPSARAFALLGGAQARDAEALLLNFRVGPAASYRTIDLPPSSERDRAESLLVAAEASLQQAIRLRPALADPWVHLLTTGRLLGLDLPELRARFENAHSRVPFRPDACRQYVTALSARAGGSDAAMFEFARWVLTEAPAGSPAHLALPMAHLEFGLGPNANSLADHLSAPDTVAELVPALHALLEETPAAATAVDLGPLNTFGLAVTVVDEWSARAVQECFRRIDNRPTSYPWVLYEDEEIAEVFAEVQRTQLRSVDRFL